MPETTFHSFSTPTSQQQKQIRHPKHNECLQKKVSVITKRTEQTQNEQYTPKQKLKSLNSRTQTRYVGNLRDNTTKDDLYELFGLRSTKYLKQNCSTKIFTNSNTGKRKYFAYVTAPQHVTTELIKLNEIQFNAKCIIVVNEILLNSKCIEVVNGIQFNSKCIIVEKVKTQTHGLF